MNAESQSDAHPHIGSLLSPCLQRLPGLKHRGPACNCGYQANTSSMSDRDEKKKKTGDDDDGDDGGPYRTPGRSWARPPLTSTTLCSWRLCPSPGMYAWRTFPDVRRTRATLRLAELGFLGLAVKTCITMPLRCGLVSSRGALERAALDGGLRRMAWLSVRSAGAEVWNW